MFLSAWHLLLCKLHSQRWEKCKDHEINQFCLIVAILKQIISHMNYQYSLYFNIEVKSVITKITNLR